MLDFLFNFEKNMIQFWEWGTFIWFATETENLKFLIVELGDMGPGLNIQTFP